MDTVRSVRSSAYANVGIPNSLECGRLQRLRRVSLDIDPPPHPSTLPVVGGRNLTLIAPPSPLAGANTNVTQHNGSPEVLLTSDYAVALRNNALRNHNQSNK